MNRFLEFLTILAKVYGFQALRPDANGACLLLVGDEKIPLLFELDEQLVPNTVLVSCPLVPLPVENRTALLRECLKVNGEIEETLSTKPDEDLLYIHRRIYPNIHEEELKKLLDSFVEKVKVYRQMPGKISPKIKDHLSPPSIEFPKYKA